MRGTKSLISSSRAAIIASVGVWTRPQANWALYLQVRARVALIPTIQSAILRLYALWYKASYSRAFFNFLNPSLIALSVTDEIHNRCIGFLICALLMIHRATSSPSRPASVAIMISLTSLRFIRFLTALYCLAVLPITTNCIFSGMMGRSFKSHFW